MLVSDFDGTYLIDNNAYELENNNLSTKALMNNDDIFVLSTGRLAEEFYQIINEYLVVANFYVLANGNVVFDNNLNVLNYNRLPKNYINKFKSFYKMFDYIVPKDIYGEINFKDAVEYEFKYKDIKYKKLFQNFLHSVGIFSYFHSKDDQLIVHVFNEKYKKADSVLYMSKLLNIEKNNIYTIGDSYNDLDMISSFNGYSVPNSIDEIKSSSKGTYNTVSELADDIRHRKI